MVGAALSGVETVSGDWTRANITVTRTMRIPATMASWVE
jgi:hypothetical protein